MATDNADRVFCKIVQRGTNAIDVGYSLTVTNGQQDYLIAADRRQHVGHETPERSPRARSHLHDSRWLDLASLTSTVTVIEGTRQSF